MLTDFPADLAAAQIDAEYIYPISTGAYWGRLMTVGLEAHGVTEFKDPSQEQLPELRTHAGANDALQRAMAEIERRKAAGLPTASYGVADSPEQLFAKYPGLAADERRFAVMFWVHRKTDQPAHSGWRWSKWGEYVGAQESKAEYLHDEPEIEQVVSFEMYEITTTSGFPRVLRPPSGASTLRVGQPTTAPTRRLLMDGTALHETAMRVAGELPSVTHTFPFGPEHDVFKVVGKIFLLASHLSGQPIVTLKCEPVHAQALRQEFETIIPGYHLNKKHWITITAGPGITADLVEELVLNAYLLVAENLPRARRPLGLEALQRAREIVVEEDDQRD